MRDGVRYKRHRFKGHCEACGAVRQKPKREAVNARARRRERMKELHLSKMFIEFGSGVIWSEPKAGNEYSS
jgi:hypothetical protein